MEVSDEDTPMVEECGPEPKVEEHATTMDVKALNAIHVHLNQSFGSIQQRRPSVSRHKGFLGEVFAL